MPNMGHNLARHNAKILAQDKPEKTTTGCNCQKSKTCPIPGKCLSEGVIYGATVKETVSGKTETYTGLSEATFKKRYTLVILRAERPSCRLPPVWQRMPSNPHCSTVLIHSTCLWRQRSKAVDCLASDVTQVVVCRGYFQKQGGNKTRPYMAFINVKCDMCEIYF